MHCEVAEMGNLKPKEIDDLKNEKFVKDAARAKKRLYRKTDCFYNIGYSFNNDKEEEGMVSINKSWVVFKKKEPIKTRRYYSCSMLKLDQCKTCDDNGDVVTLYESRHCKCKIRFPTAKSKARFISCYELRKSNAMKKEKTALLAVQKVPDITVDKCSMPEKDILDSSEDKCKISLDKVENNEKSTPDVEMTDQIECIKNDVEVESPMDKDEVETKVKPWDNRPLSEQVKEHLITQNVASEIVTVLTEFRSESVSFTVKSHLSEVDLCSANEDEAECQTQDAKIASLFKEIINCKKLQPIVEQTKNCLEAKNFESDIVSKISETFEKNIENKVSCLLKSSLIESLEQILKSNSQHINILQKCMDIQLVASKLFLTEKPFFGQSFFTNFKDHIQAEKKFRPYVLTVCGVNGVGKTTTLAKICHWLVENNIRVLIAACDTVKDGASEELQTHVKNLNDLHPPEIFGGPLKVQFHKGSNGKDPTRSAMKAIKWAISARIDVVLIDTAGRMPDNETLMRDFTIFTKVTSPDLLLFVGDAGTGNVVNQCSQFNQALVDSKCKNPHLIDGIVLTKFETVVDKVGAALSIAHSSGKPIVFVGTGQTYSDLKVLSAESVANYLIK